jgi:uncharacterized delta-60 repeat protein
MLFAIAFAGHTRAQSALDGFDPKANGIVRVVVVQPDGKILLGGRFTTLSPNGGSTAIRNYIARLNADGTLDTAFNPNANNWVYSFAVQADGKILVCGDFTSIGGQMRNGIARLDGVTGLADSFDPNPNSTSVRSIAIQSDGKILTSGGFSSIGGQTRNYIARLDPTTGLADSFNPNANGAAMSIVVQADGKILVGGFFNGPNSIGGQTRNYIARLDAATGLADSFNPNANSTVFSIAMQADGRILAGGAFATIGGQTRAYIARLDPATGLADSFNASASDELFSIAVQPDGKILVGGNFTSIGGQARNLIARLDAATGLADSFNPDANSTVLSIAVQPDGKILAGGVFQGVNGMGGQTRNYIARLETDGRLDQTLNLNVTGVISATAVQPDGKILIGGEFSAVGGVARGHIARLNTDGTLDVAFNPNANHPVRAIAVQPDGKILVGGQFFGTNSIGGHTRNHIARLDGATGMADAFDPNATHAVWAFAVTEGKILVGGEFIAIGGQQRYHIARLDAATGVADSFDPVAYVSGNSGSAVYTIIVEPDSKLLVAGYFTNIGGQTRYGIARLDPTTGMADSFNPSGRVASILAMARQSDGKILIGGQFSGPNSMGGQTRNNIARVDPVTGLADSFDPNANSIVSSIVVQADGKILVAGTFGNFFGPISIGGQSRNHMARLDGVSGMADSFDPNPNGEVFCLTLQRDGKVLAGGQFWTMGGEARSGLARLSNDTAALPNLSYSRSEVTWTRAGSSEPFNRVAFEISTDSINYSFLGIGTHDGSGWTLTNLNLPFDQNFYLRGRGFYHADGSESITESVRNAFLPRSLVGNVSTRLPVGTGDNALIQGFIVQGPLGSTKKIMVRALGPFLARFGITDALANPTLEIRDGNNAIVATNNDWKNTHIGGIVIGDQSGEIATSGLAPSDDLESAIIANLLPGNYTAVVGGVGDTTGTGIVDAYDMSPGSEARLANIATRGFIQSGDKLMIAGFIIQNASVRAAIRAIGPSLTQFGITNALPDTTLQLRDQNGAILLENDNWKSNPAQKQELENNGLQPGHDLEAALIMTIPPGQYTAQVRGKGDASGIGVVEVYFLQ